MSFLQDVLNGLGSTPKTLPCKYLYDNRGSELFHQICATKEYYITSTEVALLKQNATAIEGYASKPLALVEIGAGDGKKGEALLENIPSIERYMPLDICPKELETTTARLSQTFSSLVIEPICCDFTVAFPPPINNGNNNGKHQLLGFFSGSTIGNLKEEETRQFLTRSAQFLGKNAMMLLSADLIKEERILHNAYNDKEGATASFNLNLLTRINRELKANFMVENFRHEGRWNKQKSRMEMHLVSQCNQEVTIGGHTVKFSKDETIHTENSQKYSPSKLKELAEANGWQLVKTFTDSNDFFSVNLLKAA